MDAQGFPRRRAGLAALLIAALSLTSCKTLETYLPEMIAIGGTIIEVAALTYNDGQYAPQVSLLMATLTPAATSMAATWAENRRQQRELERLQALEAEIEAEYAALEQESAVASAGDDAGWATAHDSGGSEWTNVSPTPAPSDGGGETSPWGSAYAEWGDAYSQRGIRPRSAGAGPLELDVALLRRAGEHGVAIENGAELHDAGSAPDGRGDELRVFFSPSEDAYVYVIAIDARARVQPLFPPQLPPDGPVAAGVPVLLPGVEGWYGLDDRRGTQHVYLYASRTRRKDLEALMHRFASRPAPEASGAEYAVSEATVVEAEAVSARGLTGVAPQRIVQVQDAAGTSEFAASTATASAEDEPVVITRFFEHR